MGQIGPPFVYLGRPAAVLLPATRGIARVLVSRGCAISPRIFLKMSRSSPVQLNHMHSCNRFRRFFYGDWAPANESLCTCRLFARESFYDFPGIILTKQLRGVPELHSAFRVRLRTPRSNSYALDIGMYILCHFHPKMTCTKPDLREIEYKMQIS